ncbi:IclR family transcriptional regulator domain-containing protein [Pseudonocardia abyssalis]|uniref:IclR family transcriptional regulator domain-containing protein n=1 Tax=Pseudonocardia abyssalis TaxID=2792008 RepID=UPI001CED1167|nr:hypothetical protein [Pseudonocardia abyssalis]
MQLAVLEGVEVVFVERIAGSGAVPVLMRVGGRFALTATGLGLVLPAHAPPEWSTTSRTPSSIRGRCATCSPTSAGAGTR